MTANQTPLPSAAPPASAQPRAGVDLPEDQLHTDPLLDCLVELTRIYGRPSTRAALSAGLPISSQGLTPSLFARAASHAGFSAKVVRRALDKIDPALLPAILLLQDNQACVLLSWNTVTGNAKLLFPDSGQGEVFLSLEELQTRYAGITLFSRPRFRFDNRTPSVVDVVQKHWFWSALLEQTALFKDILAAALLINLFGIAMPLFSMNVYDRVVPNYALETLWSLGKWK